MKNKNLNFKNGMTFIELVVVIGIFAALSSIVLFNFSGFSTNLSLQNLSNQIALQIKKAQTEATSGTGGSTLFPGNCPSATPAGPCKPSYGLHFYINTKDQFSYFADYNNDGVQAVAPSSTCGNLGVECRNLITIQTSDRISKLCINDGAPPSSDCNQLTLDVAFTRPFPDAIFHYGLFGPGSITNQLIEIKSAKNFYKTIIVRPTGQIEIRNSCINKIYDSTASC